MKKILFCLQTMLLGGVEKELITVLKQIHRDFDITLLLLYLDDPEILKEIPGDVKIVSADLSKEYYFGSTAHMVKQRIKKGRIFEAASIACKRCLKIGMTGSNVNMDAIPAYEDRFDVAICYHIHSPFLLRYVVEKVTAEKKVAWIHSDFYGSGYPIQRLKKHVLGYHEFVAVSKKVEREFSALCPWYPGEVSTAYNYLDMNEIEALSKEPVDDSCYLDEKATKILTVGRFSHEKGMDIAIIASSLLKKMDLDFHWFLVGYGTLEDTYRELIEKYDVGDRVTILGRKKNPYPYIKNCDIYVQPSRHEAFGLVVLEAKILKRPIVCTDFDGADEQIVNGVNGVIVPVLDTDALSRELADLIRSPERREAFSKELEKWSPEDDLKEIVKHFA